MKGKTMLTLDPEQSEKLTKLQILDDAIAYRVALLERPCPDCASGEQCAEHAHDARLMQSYQDRYAAAFQDALAGLNATDIDRIFRPGDTGEPTACTLAVMVLDKLRGLADSGPAVTELDGETILVELDNGAVTMRPAYDA
jgi:hypothetical protein